MRVLDGVKQSRLVDRVIVATDTESIARVVRRAGGEAMLTPADLPTGSDRVAYVARRVESRFVLNVQGDAPLITPAMLDPMIEALKNDADIGLAVLAKKIDQEREVTRDSVVKMVFDQQGRALYFSRSPIPCTRQPSGEYYKHIGPYAWRRDMLLRFAAWPQTPLEKAESLEMLRMLEMGGTIKCIITETDTMEIDTPEDVRAFAALLSGLNNK